MKLWYQTMTSYRFDPLWDDYGHIMEEQIKKVARPDTEVYVTGVPVMVHEVDQFKALMMYNYVGQAMNNLFKAEKEGYDAFVIGCSYDVSMDEGRELLDIPVIGIGGIRSGKDAVEFLLCGARAVQVGTATFLDPTATVRIANELADYLVRHGIGNVNELVGALER